MAAREYAVLITEMCLTDVVLIIQGTAYRQWDKLGVGGHWPNLATSTRISVASTFR